MNASLRLPLCLLTLSLMATCCHAAADAPAERGQNVADRGAPDFTRLVKAQGAAVVNIGVAREAIASRQAGAAQDRIEDGTLGSGFIVGADGYILTNAHVVARASDISIKLSDRREYKARLLGLDTLSDVALLKIDASGLPVVRVGDPARIEVGEWVLAIGAPYGFSNSVTAGIVSAKGRSLPGADYMPFLQTDVPINPGNSGGPLFNMRGEVIGINSRIYSNSGGYQGLSFAIPIDVAMRIKEQLQARGVVTRGRIGVSVQEVSQALAQSFGLARPVGALVSYVAPYGAAARAGLKSGDVILKVDRQQVIQSADALTYIAARSPGQRMAVQIWRNRTLAELDMAVDAFETSAPLARAAVPSAPLGISVRPLAPQEQAMLRVEGGLLVERVNQAAARTGVKAGDVILSINGDSVASVDALVEQIRQARDSTGSAALLIQRASARLFVPLELKKADDAEGASLQAP
ncbi:Do family serine endopeptidase [Herbaspirillum sp. alder98]|uniref:Do family serine endopeptidase n=1 Tax=Herbaspirillum sp. alder98 TaxID=2913096 RepID=UPI001CD88046|nr:Do family serine endopeptidase [Herbaspirillum sp. alder98]MCA1325592.1 Do family serine endopeptidase [Herbaspirillum sp. alder98]